MRTTMLVLANKTASSDELFAALEERNGRTPLRLEFLVPAETSGAAAEADAQARLDAALERAREAGIPATGAVGDCDVVAAVVEAYDPRRHDEILVSTLPPSISHWLGIDLPARIGRATDAYVTRVTGRERVSALDR